jgi:dienelactone hydrolase
MMRPVPLDVLHAVTDVRDRRVPWTARFMRVAITSVLIVFIGAYPAEPQTGNRVSGVRFQAPEHPVELAGEMYRPDGGGPFPALVLLHGCGGIDARDRRWAEMLAEWGYLTLLVDSFTARGHKNVCDQPIKVDPQYARLPDAYAAQSYLAAQPFVDRTRIGVMGWSHGATTILYAVDDLYLHLPRIKPDAFKVAISFYPFCLNRLFQLNTALLILIGEEDDWTPAARCQKMQIDSGTPHGVTLRVYPGAYHGFDGLRPRGTYLGHIIGRHAEAAAKSIEEVKAFLSAHLPTKATASR